MGARLISCCLLLIVFLLLTSVVSTSGRDDSGDAEIAAESSSTCRDGGGGSSSCGPDEGETHPSHSARSDEHRDDIRDGSDGNDHHRDDDDETEDLLRQISFAQRAGVRPVTVVASVGPSSGSGRGVVYAGPDPLPAGSTAGLYRALLVRTDVWEKWLDDGTVDGDAWTEFWRSYSVEFTGESDGEEAREDGDKKEEGEEEEEEEESGRTRRHTWMAIPAGDVDGDIDGPTWWRHGLLSDSSLRGAIEAINAKVLVDWRRLAAPGGGGDNGGGGEGFLLFNAHMINEPSPGGEGEDDEAENVGHLFGSDCGAFEEEGGEEVKWCGAAFAARTSRTLYPGEQFLWCYGGTYRRRYPVAKACLEK